MKKNSRILLLALLGSAQAEEGIPFSLAMLLPIGNSTASKRSLLYYLARQNLIWIERHQDALCVGVTAQGKRRLYGQFPALLLSEALTVPDWQLIVLKQAPKSDPHFRSLAVLFSKNRVLRLARGIYAYPGTLSPNLEAQLDALYSEENLARCTVKDWQSGLDRPVIVSYYDLENLSAIYSSISKEIEQLLAIYSDQNELSDRTIYQISSIIDRLDSALIGDCGLVKRFFPKTPVPSDLVVKIGELLTTLPQPE
ncbi:hypothetical protein KA012_00630 [Candidatus Woesebacteria bacterium]|nr:hypothetical protein [Candidatus Woesebacteria bacterium]